jgi:hypothetical protein
MNVRTATIEVDKETADTLKARAAERGLTVPELVAEMTALQAGPVELSPEEMADLDRQWAAIEAGEPTVPHGEVVRWLETGARPPLSRGDNARPALPSFSLCGTTPLLGNWRITFTAPWSGHNKTSERAKAFPLLFELVGAERVGAHPAVTDDDVSAAPKPNGSVGCAFRRLLDNPPLNPVSLG